MYFSIRLKRGILMNFKKILVLIMLSSLLVGCVYAVGVTDFKIDDTLKNVYNSTDYAIYANDNNDTGISIYKYVESTDDEADAAGVFDDMIHDDGREYITADDEMNISKNSDNTVNFTDIDHGTNGISEVVDKDGEQFVVVFWAKNSGSTDLGQLMSTLNDFNKNNNLTAISF